MRQATTRTKKAKTAPEHASKGAAGSFEGQLEHGQSNITITKSSKGQMKKSRVTITSDDDADDLSSLPELYKDDFWTSPIPTVAAEQRPKREALELDQELRLERRKGEDVAAHKHRQERQQGKTKSYAPSAPMHKSGNEIQKSMGEIVNPVKAGQPRRKYINSAVFEELEAPSKPDYITPLSEEDDDLFGAYQRQTSPRPSGRPASGTQPAQPAQGRKRKAEEEAEWMEEELEDEISKRPKRLQKRPEEKERTR